MKRFRIQSSGVGDGCGAVCFYCEDGELVFHADAMAEIDANRNGYRTGQLAMLEECRKRFESFCTDLSSSSQVLGECDLIDWFRARRKELEKIPLAPQGE